MSRRSIAPVVVVLTLVAILVVPPIPTLRPNSPASSAPSTATTAFQARSGGIEPDFLTGYAITAVPGRGLLNETLSTPVKSSQTVSTFWFDWSFGDGSASINVTVPAVGGHNATDVINHVFPAYATYNVSVRINDDSSDKPQNASRSVKVSPAFGASLVPSFRNATSGTTVNEDPIVSGGSPPYQAVWSGTAPGCAIVPATLNLTCLTTLVGSYHPSVTVTDSASGKAILFGNFTINPALVIKPGYVPWYSCNGTVGTLQVNFTAGSSGGTSPVTYVWNYGDGTPNGSGTVPKHIFTLGATYQVLLHASDVGGANDSATLQVPTTFPACSGVGSPNYQPPLVVLQGGVILLVVAIVVLLILLRRRSGPHPPLAPPQPYVEPKTKAPAKAPASTGTPPPKK